MLVGVGSYSPFVYYYIRPLRPRWYCIWSVLFCLDLSLYYCTFYCFFYLLSCLRVYKMVDTIENNNIEISLIVSSFSTLVYFEIATFAITLWPFKFWPSCTSTSRLFEPIETLFDFPQPSIFARRPRRSHSHTSLTDLMPVRFSAWRSG